MYVIYAFFPISEELRDINNKRVSVLNLRRAESSLDPDVLN